jgi:hypothetical protein
MEWLELSLDADLAQIGGKGSVDVDFFQQFSRYSVFPALVIKRR